MIALDEAGRVVDVRRGRLADRELALGTSEPIDNFRDSRRASKPDYVQLTTLLVERGVRALERGSWFVSAAHDDTVIDRTLSIVEDSIRAWRQVVRPTPR